MSFKTFDWVDAGANNNIRCKKCDAPEVNYYSDNGKVHYNKKGSISPINDCNSDVVLTCKACGNTEIAEGVPGIHLG